MTENKPTEVTYAHGLTKRQVRWTLAGVMLGMLLGALDQTIVGIAMPRVVADLGGFNQYAWATSIYMITSAISIPIVGKLSDMYGRRIFYIIGIAIFAAASLACGFSQSMTQLIVFRGFQGIGGGVLMTNAFTVIADIFPPAERSKYQGLLTAVFSFASVIGPTTGGFLTDRISWHWVFFINVPVAIIAILIFIKFFPTFRAEGVKPKIDFAGAAALILVIAPSMLVLSWGGVNYAWSSPLIIGLIAFAATMLGLFLFIETRAVEPIIPLSLFKIRIVAVANITSFLTGMGMFGAVTYIPLYLQGVMGASATLSGNLQIPQSIAVMVMSIVIGQVISRGIGNYRILGVMGMALPCLGMFLMSRLTPDSHYWQVVLCNVILGFGIGTSIPVFTIAIQNEVPYKVLGTATSSNTFIRSFGGSIGLAILGTIVNNRFLTAFQQRLPEAVKNAVPMEELTALAHNPQALVNPEAQAQLKEMLIQPGAGDTIFNQVMQTLHNALSDAITMAFFTGFCILFIGVLAAFLMRGKPTVKEIKPGEKPPLRD